MTFKKFSYFIEIQLLRAQWANSITVSTCESANKPSHMKLKSLLAVSTGWNVLTTFRRIFFAGKPSQGKVVTEMSASASFDWGSHSFFASKDVIMDQSTKINCISPISLWIRFQIFAFCYLLFAMGSTEGESKRSGILVSKNPKR